MEISFTPKIHPRIHLVSLPITQRDLNTLNLPETHPKGPKITIKGLGSAYSNTKRPKIHPNELKTTKEKGLKNQQCGIKVLSYGLKIIHMAIKSSLKLPSLA